MMAMKTSCLLAALFTSVATAFAVDPPPDGGYPNQNTAEGEDALFSANGGVFNTAVGFEALYHETIGNYNTAIGANALYWNTTGLQTRPSVTWRSMKTQTARLTRPPVSRRFTRIRPATEIPEMVI